jgi:RNA polymerase sigma-70 factor (ECF subfamily)
MNDPMTPEEFTDLFRTTVPRVHAYAIRQVGRDAADDLVSETYALAWRKRDGIGIAALPWLLVVARNLAHNHRRSLRRSDHLWLDAVRDQWRASPPSTPETQVLQRETALSALAACTEMEREALLLTAWDGLNASDAAKVAGCSTRAFTVRLSRARARFEAHCLASDSPEPSEGHRPRLASVPTLLTTEDIA